MPTHYKGSPGEILALNTFIKFTRAANSVEGHLYRQDIIEDLTTTQFGVLETLYHLGSLCQTELSGKLLKSTSNMTLVLDNLEKRGLVQRQPHSKDRRTTTVDLTPAGKELIARVFPKVVENIERQFSVLTVEEQEMFGILCRKLGKKLSE